MINLKIPITILRKKTRPLCKGRFIATYEYGRSEYLDAGNSKEHELPQVTDADLCMPVRCSWTDVTIRFPE